MPSRSSWAIGLAPHRGIVTRIRCWPIRSQFRQSSQPLNLRPPKKGSHDALTICHSRPRDPRLMYLGPSTRRWDLGCAAHGGSQEPVRDERGVCEIGTLLDQARCVLLESVRLRHLHELPPHGTLGGDPFPRARWADCQRFIDRPGLWPRERVQWGGQFHDK